MESLGVGFDLFELIGDIEMLAGESHDFLFAVELLDALQSPLMLLVLIFNAIQLHYPHWPV